MVLGELLELLLKEENQPTCRWVGGFMVVLSLAFCLGGGFPQGADGDAVILSKGWFREVFLVLMGGILLVGLLLLWAGLTGRTSDDDES